MLNTIGWLMIAIPVVLIVAYAFKVNNPSWGDWKSVLSVVGFVLYLGTCIMLIRWD